MSEVIELNNHRLLNGDATCKADVDRLIGDDTVNLLLTDPPYGIDIVKVGGGKSVDMAVMPSDLSIGERESIWQRLEEQNHQPSKTYGTVGTPAVPGFAKRGGDK